MGMCAWNDPVLSVWSAGRNHEKNKQQQFHVNNQLLIQSDTSLHQCLSCRSGLDCTSLLSKSMTYH